MSNTIFFLYLLQKEFSALSLGDGGVESSTSLFAFLKRKQSVSQRRQKKYQYSYQYQQCRLSVTSLGDFKLDVSSHVEFSAWILKILINLSQDDLVSFRKGTSMYYVSKKRGERGSAKCLLLLTWGEGGLKMLIKQGSIVTKTRKRCYKSRENPVIET